jgi:hypothetical protein
MGNIPNDLKFLTHMETAEMLRVSPRTLFRMFKQKKIPSLTVAAGSRMRGKRGVKGQHW